MEVEALYGYWRSSCSWRVRIALHFKGLDGWRYEAIHLVEGGGQQHTEAHQGRNPMRQVPVLEVHGESVQGPGVFHLSQSMAILEFLEERYPEPRLLPADPIARARSRALAEVVNAGIQPLQNLAVIQKLRDELGLDAVAWCRDFIGRGLEAYEAQARQWGKGFSVGDQPTFADICLVPQLYNARRFGLPLQDYPTLLAIESHCQGLAPFQAAHPDEQPDAPAPENR